VSFPLIDRVIETVDAYLLDRQTRRTDMKWLHLEIRDLRHNHLQPTWISLRYDQIVAYE